ncbi:MAG: DUF2330 domain-containing protein [Methanomassiliicoccales archaeon]|nr:MAG: DUF2330 domain-containing protein [Methanomassiliicoccales archaeon]
MKGIARRVLVGFVVLQFISIPLSGCVVADGGVFSKHGELIYLAEDSQSAIIDYCEGTQRMLISVEFEWQDLDDVAWIFPIPSDPDRMETDILDGAPEFYGTDVVEEARSSLLESFYTFQIAYASSALLPLPLTMLISKAFLSWSSRGSSSPGALGLEGGGAGGTTVTVHSHMEKYGLVVEVISATEGQGIYDYLTGEGLDVSEGAVPQLDEYVEKEYSFVVTWIEESTESTRELGVMVEFPTEAMFYPLMLTSIYGDEVIPMKILVTKHVIPELYPEIEPYTDVRYFGRGRVRLDYEREYEPETWQFVNNIEDNWNRTFTLIEISAPSKNLKDDLWMKSGAPSRVSAAPSISAAFGGLGSILTLLLIVLVASILSQLTAGGLVIGWKRETIPYYLLFGITNLVGAVFFVILAVDLRERLNVTKRTLGKFIGLFFVFFYAYVTLIFAAFFLALF